MKYTLFKTDHRVKIHVLRSAFSLADQKDSIYCSTSFGFQVKTKTFSCIHLDPRTLVIAKAKYTCVIYM